MSSEGAPVSETGVYKGATDEKDDPGWRHADVTAEFNAKVALEAVCGNGRFLELAMKHRLHPYRSPSGNAVYEILGQGARQ